MPKPGEFFIGITEFFAILVPGFVVLLGVDHLMHGSLGVHVPDAMGWAVLLVASYITGSVFFAIGSFLDVTYNRWAYARQDGPALKQVKKLRKTKYPDLDFDTVNNYKWSRSVLQAARPAAWTEVQRAETDSKLFRSLVIPFVLFTLAEMWRGSTLGHEPPAATVAAFGAMIAFQRYWHLRTKACETAYEHVLVYLSTPDLRNAEAREP